MGHLGVGMPFIKMVNSGGIRVGGETDAVKSILNILSLRW